MGEGWRPAAVVDHAARRPETEMNWKMMTIKLSPGPGSDQEMLVLCDLEFGARLAQLFAFLSAEK